MDYSKYLGTWVNTFQEGHTITRFRLYEEGGSMKMETETTREPKNWGVTSVFPFGYEKTPQIFAAFEARYDIESNESLLCVNESKGLLIVAGFHRIKTEPGNKSFFTREFFHKD